MAASRRNISYFWCWLLLAAVIFTLYARSIAYPFLGYDDTLLIVENQKFLSQPGNAAQIFLQDSWSVAGHESSGSYYRPLYILSFMLDSQLAGPVPTVFHVTSILLHAVASCLIFQLLVQLGARTLTSLVLAIAFAVHPALVAVVAWVPGRNDSLVALFVVCSFLWLGRFLKNGGWKNMAGHLVCFGLALLTKETALALPVVAFLLVNEARRHRGVAVPRALLLGWAGVAALWVGLRFVALGSSGLGHARLSNLGANSIFLIHYLGKAFFPFRLALFPTLEDTGMVPGLLALALLLVLLLFWARRNPDRLLLGAGWFLFFLLPTLLVPVLVGLEQRLYLPLVGLLILLAQVEWVAALKVEVLSILAVVLVTGFLAGMTWRRIPDFSNRTAFWTAAVASSPHSALALFNLGSVELEASHSQDAERLLRRALAINPSEPMANNNLGVLLVRSGKLRDALPFFERETQVNPRYADAYFNLGLTWSKLGHDERAVPLWEKVLELRPGHRKATEFLARYYLKTGDLATGAAYLESLQERKSP